MIERDLRVDNLRRANERKTAAARAAVEASVSQLVQDGERINVNAVARASGVSRGFIYEHDDLRQLISGEAERSKKALRRSTPTPNEVSLTARLTTALDTIKELKKQKLELERRIENLSAQLFDREAGL